MYLEKIIIENFRPFNELKINFNSKLNVFIGLNGAGKTAILDSIAIAFVPYIAKLTKSIWTKQLALKDSDIHIGKQKTTINIEIVNNNINNWLVSKKLSDKKIIGDFKILNQNIEQILNNLDNNNLLNLPIIAYYSTSRMIFDNTIKISLNKSRYEFNQFLAFENCLFTGINSFNNFILWFENEEGYEDKIRLDKDSKYRNPKLQTIRNAIELFLNNFESNKVSFKNIRIKKERNENNIKYYSSIVSSLVITKNETDFQLEQLSSGEKMMLMLIVDIARRLTIANPLLDNPLFGEGIILIDEIDLHLHPQWQREIIGALNATFPNCQFIITTHSPQVLSKIKKENIFVIEDNKIIEEPSNTYGKDSNSILYEIFNTLERPKNVQDKLDNCFKFIETEKFDNAKEILIELVNILGEDDSQVIKIKSLLTFYQE